MFDVANWVACLNGENSPGGTPSHEALQFHLKEDWRYLQSLDSLLRWTEAIAARLDRWQNPSKVMKGADLHPKTTVSNSLQTPQRRLGRSLRSGSTRVCGQTGKWGYT